MSDTELKITKEKVLEAAKKCATAKQVLSTLFPEAFEKKMYKCGTIFVEEGAVVFFVEKNEVVFVYKDTIPTSALNRFWILAHSAKPREYHLINMRTGFSEKRPPNSGTWTTFIRDSPNGGIEIPDEALKGLKVFSVPEEQKPFRKMTAY